MGKEEYTKSYLGKGLVKDTVDLRFKIHICSTGSQNFRQRSCVPRSFVSRHHSLVLSPSAHSRMCLVPRPLSEIESEVEKTCSPAPSRVDTPSTEGFRFIHRHFVVVRLRVKIGSPYKRKCPRYVTVDPQSVSTENPIQHRRKLTAVFCFGNLRYGLPDVLPIPYVVMHSRPGRVERIATESAKSEAMRDFDDVRVLVAHQPIVAHSTTHSMSTSTPSESKLPYERHGR